MILNEQQLTAVENGDPVAKSVASTGCNLIRRDVYLRSQIETDTGSWSLEEMDLLADEAEDIISQGECHESWSRAHGKYDASTYWQ